MNPESQKIFDEILKKPLEELNEEDKAFLKARSYYLSPTEKEIYKDVLAYVPAPQKPQELIVNLSPVPTAPTKPVEPVVDDITTMKYPLLMKKAKELGFKVRVGLKREELQDMILSKS